MPDLANLNRISSTVDSKEQITASSKSVRYPLVSILMNCFNGEKYLRQAIESVLSQSYKNWELVFWDNRSTDSSAAIVNGYKDSRIRYFLSPTHTSFGAARVLASQEISGEWITVLDSDDYWLDNNLEIRLANYTVDDEIGIMYSRSIVDRREINKQSTVHPRLAVLPEGWILKHLLASNFIPGHTALYRTTLFTSVGGFGGLAIGEYLLALQISKIAKVRVCDTITAVYRRHGKNITTTQKDSILLERRELLSYFPDKRSRRTILASIHYDSWRSVWAESNWHLRSILMVKLFVPDLIGCLFQQLVNSFIYRVSGLHQEHRLVVKKHLQKNNI
jgi:glycosyltransferase involved in cell wall biosynthesis